MKKFTPEEDQFILDNYLTMPIKRISKMLGRADSVARQRLERLGYKVPKEVAAKFARESRYAPGSVPPNKGKDMPAEVKEKVKHTWFQRGNLPHNSKADGVIVSRRDNSGRNYLYIREAKAKWELLHRHLWRKHHGEIPPGMNVVFKDGNSENCQLDNLELVDRQALMKRNTIHNLPEEIRNTKLLIGSLNRKINRHEQNHQ